MEIYRVSKAFPVEERFGLTSQMRRAAVSIASNLAEGCGRKSRPDFLRFIHIAGGSAAECEYQILLARDLDLVSAEKYDKLNADINEIKRMLQGLEQALRRRANDE